MSVPSVHILVLSRNGKRDTLECLASLSQITYPHARAVLIDNASTDGTAQAVRDRFPDVAVLENDRNYWFAEGNNIGIRYALSRSADYVLLLNNDTVVHRTFVDDMVALAEDDPQAGIVGPKIYYYHDRDILWFAGGRINFWTGEISHRGLRRKDSPEYDRVVEVDYVTGCALLARRRMIEEVGLLHPSYAMYGADVDGCQRARQAGWKSLFCPTSRVWHKVSATTGGNVSPFKLCSKAKSNIAFFAQHAKWYHLLSLPFCMPLTLAGRTYSLFRETRTGRRR